MDAPKQDPSSEPATTSSWSALLRVFWMLLGNGVLFFCAYFIADRPSKAFAFSFLDAIYWGTAAAMAAARYVDVCHLHGTTAAGSPATTAHLRRYLLILLGVTLCAWGLAHGIARWRA